MISNIWRRRLGGSIAASMTVIAGLIGLAALCGPSRADQPSDGDEPGHMGLVQAQDEKPAGAQPPASGAERRRRGTAKPPAKGGQNPNPAGEPATTPTQPPARPVAPPPTNPLQPPNQPVQGTPPPGETEPVTSHLNLDAEDIGKPPEERTYSFSIVDGTYKDLVENFARMAGMGIVGEAPVGMVTFVSTEEMTYKAALNRVRMLLFKYKPLEPYWMLPHEKHFEVLRVTDVWRQIPLEQIFTNIKAFEESGIDDDELAMVQYTPAGTSVADFTLLRDFMPDYVRIAPMADTNSLAIFALVRDIKKYLSLIHLFEGAGDDPRIIEKITTHYVTPTEAVDGLRRLMDDLDETSPGAPPQPPRQPQRAGEQPIDLPGQRTVLYPDDAQGVLIVRAVPKKIDRIKQFLPYVDVDTNPPDTDPVKIPIKYATVDEILTILNPLVAESGGTDAAAPSPPRPRPPRAAGRRGAKAAEAAAAATAASPVTTAVLQLIPDHRTNTLIVKGAEPDVERVKRLVAMFDVPTDGEHPEFVQLMFASADQMSATVTQIITGTSPKRSDGAFSAIADAPSNSLILVGSREEIAQAKYLIGKLDTGDSSASLHSYKLLDALPSKVMEIIKMIESQQAGGAPPAAAAQKSGGRGARRRQQPQAAAAGGNIFADDATMMIYIVCSEEEWTQNYQPLMERLDSQAGQLDDHVSIPVTNLPADEIITTLNELFGATAKRAVGTIKFAATPTAILVTGATRAEIGQIKSIVADLDRESIGRERRLFNIEHADPGEIKTIIESGIVGTHTASAARRPGKPAQAVGPSEEGIIAAVMDKTLIVSGLPAQLDEVADLIEHLDVPSAKTNETRVYKVPAGHDVHNVVTLLEALVASTQHVSSVRANRPAGATPAPVPAAMQMDDIRFVPQPAARRFIVSAPVERFAEIEKAITVILEGAPPERAEIRFFATHHVDAAAIAALIEPILQIRAGELASTGEITTEAPEPGKRGGAVVSMKNSAVTVSTDVGNSRIVVMAPPALLAEAETLIAELDHPSTEEKRVVKTIMLSKAGADEMVAAIHAMMSGERAAPRPATPHVRRQENKGANPAAAAAAAAGAAVPGAATMSAQVNDVNVVAAPGGRGIVLSGTADAVAEVEEWVHILDENASSETVLKVYRIKHADLEPLADTIMDLCDVGIPKAPPMPGGKGGDLFEPALKAPGGVRKGAEITLTTDYWNKVILARATPLKMFEIDQIVELFEGSEDEEPIIKGEKKLTPFLIYSLENVDPFDAVLALEDLFKVVWTHGDEPKVDYISGTKNLVVKCLPEFNTEVENLIKEYVDKSKGKPKSSAVAYTTVSGETAGNVIKLLQIRVPGVKVNIKQLDEEIPKVEELGPYQPPKEKSEPSSSAAPSSAEKPLNRYCVLPLPMMRALVPMVEAVMGQTAEKSPAKESQPETKESKEESARKMMESLKAQDAKRQADDKDPGQTTAPAVEETPEVNIRFDDRQGVIAIEGPPQAVDDVRDALKDIQEEIDKIGSRYDIRVFRIKYRNVNAAASILETMFNAAMTPQQQQAMNTRMAMQQQQMQQQQMMRMQQQQMAAAGKGQQPGALPQPGGEKTGEKEKDKDEEETKKEGPGEIRIFPDPQTGTLIIRAAKEDFPIIVDLLATIDRPADVAEDFRIFHFKHLIASEVEGQVKELLGIARSSQPTIRRPTNARGRGAMAGAQGQQNPMQQLEEQLMNLNMFGGDMGGGGGAIDVANDVKITSNPTANTLLVMAPPSALKVIEKFIDELEKQEIPIVETRTYKIQFADATEIAAQLKDMFGSTRGAAGAQREQAEFNPTTINQVTIVADPRTNSLLVSAFAPDFVHIEPLIQQLDTKLPGEDNVVTVKLNSADAGQTATTLTTVYAASGAGGGRGGAGAGAKAIKFVGDAASNTLFITAPADQREQILARVREIDTQAAAQAKPKTIQLTEGKASDVARALQSAIDNRHGTVKFFGDDTSNQVIVTAPDEMFTQIETLAKSMDQSSTKIDTRVFQLKHARATAVHGYLMDMVRQLATQLKGRNMDVFSAVADERSNTIVCVGGPVAFLLVEQVIKEVDIPQSETGSTRTRQILVLEHASAADLARIIGDDLKAAQTGASTASRAAAPSAVSIIANEALNALLISGTNEEVQSVIDLAKDMDKPIESGEIEIITLKYNDAEAMRGVLENYLSKPGQGGGGGRGAAPGGLRGDVRISANPQNNSIILSGGRRQLDDIKAVVAKLDVEVEGAGNAPKIIPILHARASQIEPVLTQMFVDSARNRGGSGTTTTMTPVIAADEVSNSLIVRCSASDLGQIKSLIEELDTDTMKDQTTFTVVPVAEGVKVADLADMVQTTINEGERIKADRWGTEPGTIVVTADARTNALIVAGSASLFPDAERLVHQMESMGPTGGRRMQVIKTNNLPPEEVRRLLDQIIGDNGTGSGGGNRGAARSSSGSSGARPKSSGSSMRRPSTPSGSTSRPSPRPPSQTSPTRRAAPSPSQSGGGAANRPAKPPAPSAQPEGGAKKK